MEIYNEVVRRSLRLTSAQINDLLDARGTNLKIREDPNEGAFVAGARSHGRVQCVDAYRLLGPGR